LVELDKMFDWHSSQIISALEIHLRVDPIIIDYQTVDQIFNI